MSVASTALDEANRQLRGHPYAARIRKALIEAGIVESNLTNLASGDRDSQGFLQQRPSQGWGTVAQVRDVRHATRSFIARAKPIAGKYKSAGQLAQAVQRSAFPAKYDQVAGQARSILRGSPSTGGSGGRGGTNTVAIPGVPGSGGGIATQQLGSAASAEALVQSLQPPPQPPMGPVPPPAVMAGPVLPTVRGVPSPSAPSFGSPAPPPDVQDTIRAAAALRRDVAPTPQQDSGIPGVVIPGQEGGGAAAGGSGPAGKVSIRAGADRPGVKTKPAVVKFAEQVAGTYGHSLTIGTGTNHNRLVKGSGRVSNHWTGNAADIPMAGAALTRLGQAALVAAGWSPARARKAKGGVYNVGNIQILFNTNVGGNHFNHLHIGVR